MKVTSGLVFVATFAMPAIIAHGGTSPATMSEWLDCVINPSQVVEIGSPVEGILSEIFVDRGDEIKGGEILARLQADVESANVELARVRYENNISIESGRSRAEYYEKRKNRSEKMFKRKIVSAEDMELAETEWILAINELLNAEYQKKIAKVELQRAEALLAQKTIRSPFDGVVVKKLLSPGAFVHDQANILKIAAIDPLYVETYSPISMYPFISEAREAEVVTDKPFSKSYAASVIVVDSVFDAASGTFGVRLSLPNPDRSIPAGMKCNVRFQMNTE